MIGSWQPGERSRGTIGSAINDEARPGNIGLHGHVNRILSEAGHLGDRSAHRDRSRIIRTGIGPGASAAPTGEGVAHLRIVSRLRCYRDDSSAVFPAARRSHGAASPRLHGQKVLFGESCRVGRVHRRRDRVRNRTIVAPFSPVVTGCRARSLRRSGGNRMARPGRPGECLR